jgi:hypothetical protein
MAARKSKNGLITKLKTFVDALGDRYQRALQVIDEALASDSLKDKIWAVDLILKRTPTPTPDVETPRKEAAELPSAAALDGLSDAELLNRIRGYLQDWEP